MSGLGVALQGFSQGFGLGRDARLRREEKDQQKKQMEQIESYLQNLRPMGAVQADAELQPQPRLKKYRPQGRGSKGVSADRLALANGIYDAAKELQMEPEDLATIISYETAGTFDPMKPGPKTQWGQHKGLIQFGEPQAKQYGVDWSRPVDSQLGRNGAVVRYFRENGWKPGMGMLDAYSIVNAGAPGRYNASDANNGGAAGTVRDKVTSQMAGHRAKAAQLMALRPRPQTIEQVYLTQPRPMGVGDM